jgi:hypothetical protein
MSTRVQWCHFQPKENSGLEDVTMSSWFSRKMDGLVEGQFNKDPSGRLVFIPFTRRGRCYFVDAKADVEKVKAFVKMYRIATAVISVLTAPILVFFVSILEDYGGLTPRAHRLTIILGLAGFFWLSLVAVQLILWFAYKATVPGLTASLSEVGPDSKAQLRAISTPSSRRLALVCLFAGLLLMGLAIVVLTAHHVRR